MMPDIPQSTTPTAPGAAQSTGVPLAEFVSVVGKLDERAFINRYGSAFLLHHGALGDLSPALRPQATILAEPGKLPPSSAAPQLDFLVFAVRQSEHSPFPAFISLGRTKNNDIVINDVSISKFHAYFRIGEGDTLLLQDSGSKNGTFINEKPVPTRDAGPAVALSAGDSLRFGTVTLTFLPAAAFRSFVTQLTS